MSTYRVVVDGSLCSGFGSCISAAPTVFTLERSGVAEVASPETTEHSAVEAALSCPMGAIAVLDGESGERLA